MRKLTVSLLFLVHCTSTSGSPDTTTTTSAAGGSATTVTATTTDTSVTCHQFAPACLPGSYSMCEKTAASTPCCGSINGGLQTNECMVPAGVSVHGCPPAEGVTCKDDTCAISYSGTVTCCLWGAIGPDGGTADPCQQYVP